MDYTQVLCLTGKVAVITGGASGIGLAAGRALAQCGAAVVLVDINGEAAQAAAQDICGKGHEALGVQCDVTNADSCKAAVEAAVAAFGGIDILYNNAGVILRKNVVDTDEAGWDRVVDVTLKGCYLMSKYAIPHMVQRGGGSIVNTGSGWGMKGGDNAASYCAAKGGIVNLTRAMAIDFGPQNIRVNCVSPGDTDTPLLRGEAHQLGLEEGKFLVESGCDRPLGRIGTPEDIANAVVFFASDLSSWVTGATLVVDGGGLA